MKLVEEEKKKIGEKEFRNYLIIYMKFLYVWIKVF